MQALDDAGIARGIGASAALHGALLGGTIASDRLRRVPGGEVGADAP